MTGNVKRWFARQLRKLQVALDPESQQNQPRITLTGPSQDQELAQRAQEHAATASRLFSEHPHPLQSNPPPPKRKPVPSRRATNLQGYESVVASSSSNAVASTETGLPTPLTTGPTPVLASQHNLKPPLPRVDQHDHASLSSSAPPSWRDSYQQQPAGRSSEPFMGYQPYSRDFRGSCRDTTFGIPEPLTQNERPETANTLASDDPDIPMNQSASSSRFKKHYSSVENCDSPFMNGLDGMIPNPRPLSPKIPLAPSKCHRNFDEDSLPFRDYLSKTTPDTNQETAASSSQHSPSQLSRSDSDNAQPRGHSSPPQPPRGQQCEAETPRSRDTTTYNALTANEQILPFPPTPTDPHIIYRHDEWLRKPHHIRWWIKFQYYWHDWLEERPKPWQDD